MSRMQRAVTVLIVEDETIPAEYLRQIIEESGEFKVIDIVSSALEALEAVKKRVPEIIFMDILLEGAMSGAELALKLHTLHAEILTIFMTAYSTEEMVEYAVESEAFAYLLKPYRPKEIRATLRLAKARLRKPIATPTPSVIKLADGFAYDKASERLCKNGESMALSPHELQLLQILCRDPGTVVERNLLLDQLQLSDTALRSLVYRLRKITSTALIQSVKRLGYRISTV